MRGGGVVEEFLKQSTPNCVWRVKKAITAVITGHMKRSISPGGCVPLKGIRKAVT